MGGAPGSTVDDPLAELTGAPAVVLATDPAARAAQLAATSRVTYRVIQRFGYSYDGAAHDLVHRLAVIPPPRHGDQVRRAFRIDISDPAAALTWERTSDGGVVAVVRLARVPSRLEFVVFAVVERDGDEPPRLPASALTGRRLLNPTALTRPDARIRAVASSLMAGDPVTTARRCASWVHRRIAYTEGVTGVVTPAAEALAGGRGVCQDQAHVTLSLCRAAGVPARYVSGHLLGDGGTHAWVEVIVPDPAADGTAR
ncbi:MAG: transglutaminase domain-containing protein, partial [Frankia sp.]